MGAAGANAPVVKAISKWNCPKDRRVSSGRAHSAWAKFTFDVYGEGSVSKNTIGTKKGTLFRSLFTGADLLGLAHLPFFNSRDVVTNSGAELREETLKHKILL